MAKRSPVKSISVREAEDGKAMMHLKNSDNKYKSIANFNFAIKEFVEFPLAFQNFSGYLLQVQRTDDVSL